MTAISPVVPKNSRALADEIVFAKDQPEYLPLPAFRDQSGRVVTRWRLTLRERLRILFCGDLWLHVLTFNQPLQPVLLETVAPIVQYEE